MTPPVVLSIAATDPGGGAGLAADLATFAEIGVHGTCVVTAVTAQDTLGVHAVHPIPVNVVAAQLDAVLNDLPVAVVKTGMLASPEVVHLVAERCADRPLIVDPVIRATAGTELAGPDVVRAYRKHLLPRAHVVTPNRAEAAILGPFTRPVVETGSETATDTLRLDGRLIETLRHEVVQTDNDHGTGCTFSAALAAYTAYGIELPAAVRLAGAFTARHLAAGRQWDLGRGRGPIAHTMLHPPTYRFDPTGGTR